MVTAMTELLAPAGDRASAMAAINSGADAIYLGLKSFSARASADNFDFDGLASLCDYAHALGVRVHVALNTLVKDAEVQSFVSSATAAWNAGADALIIQDIFLGAYLKETYPKLCLHLSTQAGVNNVYGARLAKRYGFGRVILARETPLDEIKKIAKIIQTEVFVQGALCTCFSGQCYLSSFAGGNSGNRGRCKQPCRKLYSIDRRGYEDKAYALSLSDLSVGEDILSLADAGVYSFKIEGRMRRPEYVSAAVSYYRGILDGTPSPDGLSALKRTYNRGNYTKGLAFGQDKTFISRAVQGHIGEFCGTVKVVNGRYLCLSAQPCKEGDSFKILRGGREIGGAVFCGRAKEGFYISSGSRLCNGDKVFITTDAALNSRLLAARKLRKIIVSARIAEGEPLYVYVDGKRYESSFVIPAAVSRASGAEDIVRSFGKTDAYPFLVEYGDIAVGGRPFLPASSLNAFRRQVYADYFASLSRRDREKIRQVLPLPEIPCAADNARTAVIACDLGGVEADVGIFKPRDYKNIDISGAASFAGEKYLFLPPFMDDGVTDAVKSVLPHFDGVYSDGLWAIEFCREQNKPLFAGCGMNIANGLSLSRVPARYVVLSKELTFAETKPLARSNTFCLTAGDIKVMDIVYCPFGKTCKNCDRRDLYSLTDESGRVFPMRRYVASGCAFELYNCSPLVAPQSFTGALADCTLCDPRRVAPVMRDSAELKKYFVVYTSGHSKKPVL